MQPFLRHGRGASGGGADDGTGGRARSRDRSPTRGRAMSVPHLSSPIDVYQAVNEMNAKLVQLDRTVRKMGSTIDVLAKFKGQATSHIEQLLQQNVKDDPMQQYVSTLPDVIRKAE